MYINCDLCVYGYEGYALGICTMEAGQRGGVRALRDRVVWVCCVLCTCMTGTGVGGGERRVTTLWATLQHFRDESKVVFCLVAP
jgi:hypothetical protein